MTEEHTSKKIAAEHHETKHGVTDTDEHQRHGHQHELEPTHKHGDSNHRDHETERQR